MRKISLALLIGILLLSGCGKVAKATGSDGGSAGGGNNPPASTLSISGTVTVTQETNTLLASIQTKVKCFIAKTLGAPFYAYAAGETMESLKNAIIKIYEFSNQTVELGSTISGNDGKYSFSGLALNKVYLIVAKKNNNGHEVNIKNIAWGLSSNYNKSIDINPKTAVIVAAISANATAKEMLLNFSGTTDIDTAVSNIATAVNNYYNIYPLPPVTGNILVPSEIATDVSSMECTLTITKTGEGTVTATPASATGKYIKGTEVTLQASGSGEYGFRCWENGLTDSANPDTVTMDGNKTVNAVFTRQRVVLIPKLLVVGGSENGVSAQGTASISPEPVSFREFKRFLTYNAGSGSGEVTLLEYSYDYNTPVVITATANASDKEFYGFKVTESITLSDYSSASDGLWEWIYTNPMTFDITKNIQIRDVATEYPEKLFSVPAIGDVTYDGLPTEWAGIEYAATSNGSNYDSTFDPIERGTKINGVKLAQKDGELYLMIDFKNGNPDTAVCDPNNYASVATGELMHVDYQFVIWDGDNNTEDINNVNNLQVHLTYKTSQGKWSRFFHYLSGAANTLDNENKFNKAMANTPAQVVETSIPISEITSRLTKNSKEGYWFLIHVQRFRKRADGSWGDPSEIDVISKFYIKF